MNISNKIKGRELSSSKSGWKLHGTSDCMTEFVLDCFHRDYFLLYIVSTFDEDNVRGHIKLITNLFHTRHARENHTQGKLRDGYTPLTLEECGIVAATLSPVTFLIFKCQFILFRQPSVWRGPNAVLSRGPEEWAAFVGRHKQLRRPRILCGHFLLACFFFAALGKHNSAPMRFKIFTRNGQRKASRGGSTPRAI